MFDFLKKKTYDVKLDGLHCMKCVEKVQNAVKSLGGKIDIDLKLGRGSLSLPEKIDFDTIKKAIEALGFKCDLLK